MKTKFPYPLTADVMGTLTVDLTVGKEMRMQADRLGYGPDEMQNLIGMKSKDAARLVCEALGIPYDDDEA